jgi:superfamily II DNA or RNA helicase
MQRQIRPGTRQSPQRDAEIVFGGKVSYIPPGVAAARVRKGEISDLVADYGRLVVDECHHLSAVSFEAVARAAKAKYVVGLSATVTRKDGHHPIIFMQCGPIRYRVDARRHRLQDHFRIRL